MEWLFLLPGSWCFYFHAVPLTILTVTPLVNSLVNFIQKSPNQPPQFFDVMRSFLNFGMHSPVSLSAWSLWIDIFITKLDNNFYTTQYSFVCAFRLSIDYCYQSITFLASQDKFRFFLQINISSNNHFRFAFRLVWCFIKNGFITTLSDDFYMLN